MNSETGIGPGFSPLRERNATRFVFLLLVTDDEHIGNLLVLGIADLGIHALTAIIHLNPQTGSFEFLC